MSPGGGRHTKRLRPENGQAAALAAVAGGERHYSRKFRETLAAESAKVEGVGKILSRRE